MTNLNLGEHKDVKSGVIRLGATVAIRPTEIVPICAHCLTALDPYHQDDLAERALREHWTARHPGIAA